MNENQTKKRIIQKDNIFNEIPTDIWSIIIFYLNGQNDFLKLILVSKQLYKTLCPQALNQIIWKIISRSLKNTPKTILSFCTPFEKKYFDHLKIDFILNDYFYLQSDSLPKNLYGLSLDLSKLKNEELIFEYLKDPSLKVLEFYGDKNMRMINIFKNLEKNSSLTHLELSGDIISVEATKYLEKLLEQNNSLKILNVSSCGLINEGVKHIMKGLKRNKSLKILDLANNLIDEEGGKSIGELLEQNNTLEILNLIFNNIKDEGTIYIAKSLEKNNSLKILNLGFLNYKIKE